MKTLLVLAALLPGCVNLPADPTSMSAEQLKEWAKDKNANISCASKEMLVGHFSVVTVTLDKGLLKDGSLAVDADCKIIITTTGK